MKFISLIIIALVVMINNPFLLLCFLFSSGIQSIEAANNSNKIVTDSLANPAMGQSITTNKKPESSIVTKEAVKVIDTLIDSFMKSNPDSNYTFEWKIRGVTAIGDYETIFLSPIMDRIDTVYYHKLSDHLNWYSVLTRISHSGEYKGLANPCCGGFLLKSEKKIPIVRNHVEFNLTSTDGKLYLGRVGENGKILKRGQTVSITSECAFMRSAMAYTSTEISIEEIDTVDCGDECVHIEDEDGINPESYPPGIVIDPLEKRDYCLSCGLNCYNGRECQESSMCFSYCSKRRIAGFDFVWLDDKPLQVEFDARNNKLTLK
jgi:hypothetical protein